MRDFESKLNQQNLVEMGTRVSREITSAFHSPSVHFYQKSFLGQDPQAQLGFLSALLSRIDVDKSKEAHVLLLANIAHAKLVYSDLEGTKKDMDTAWKTLDQLEDVDNAVNASYYRVAADYYKVTRTIEKVPVDYNADAIEIVGESRICPVLQAFVAVFGMC